MKPLPIAEPSAAACATETSILDVLEAEAIHIIREVAAESERPALLFSGGKDSVVMLHLARKAFYPTKPPFPVLHIDTGHNFPEVIEFRDRFVLGEGDRLLIASVEEAITRGIVHEDPRAPAGRNLAQIPTLLDAITTHRFDALFGGARRDEERARAKDRIFSFRDDMGRWDPRSQRPELWDIYNARIRRSQLGSTDTGEHLRVFPLSNFTELDIWEYIAREKLAIPSIYFAHERDVVIRAGRICPLSDIFPPKAGEPVHRKAVRFRTVGDMSCTAAIESSASTVQAIIHETRAADVSERGSRLDDTVSEAAMEDRKREGYF